MAKCLHCRFRREIHCPALQVGKVRTLLRERTISFVKVLTDRESRRRIVRFVGTDRVSAYLLLVQQNAGLCESGFRDLAAR